MGKFLLGLSGLGLISFSLSYACPTPQQLEPLLNKKQSIFKVEKIEPSPVKGVCQVITELKGFENKPKIVLYVDETGRYIFLGARNGLTFIYDLKKDKNLTAEVLEEINKLSSKDVKNLDKYVAFTYGNKGKVIYLFTDPECPFCQKLEPTLKKLADEGKIQIKVILYPLPFHAHAKEKAIAMVCHNIGWKGLQNKYWNNINMENLSKWQCEKGKKLVEESIKIGNKYGITGTPTIITQDGKKIVGALPEPVIKKELGIK
jgi:thiol:disulfide interchange protein DsbC